MQKDTRVIVAALAVCTFIIVMVQFYIQSQLVAVQMKTAQALGQVIVKEAATPTPSPTEEPTATPKVKQATPSASAKATKATATPTASPEEQQ
jgi:hypothetical protein